MLLGRWRKDGLGDEYSVHVKSVWLPCGWMGMLSDCRVGTLSGGATMESARSRRRREMGDVAVCLRRGLDSIRERAIRSVELVWRAATRGCYPVEEVELYSEARVEHFAEDELREWRCVVDLRRR